MFYKVSIGYNYFMFSDGDEAISFAESALRTLVEDDKKYPIKVTIELIKVYKEEV